VTFCPLKDIDCLRSNRGELRVGLYKIYARRMGQPTQRATNYTARSNIDTAQIFLYANGQRPKRAMIRQRSRRRQRRGEPHTEHGLGVTFHTHTAASMKRDRRKSLFVCLFGDCALVNTILWHSPSPSLNPTRCMLKSLLRNIWVPPAPPCVVIQHTRLVLPISFKYRV